MKTATALALTAALAAGCGGVRMSSEVRDRDSGKKMDYALQDPDARAMAAPSDGCWEKREGRLTFALCPAPEKITAGVPLKLILAVEERKGGKDAPARGGAVTAEFRHRGQRVLRERDLVHPDPIVGLVRESSPGRYEIPVTFPVGGKWAADFRAVFPDGRDVRVGFPVAVEGGNGGNP